jgi:hypothetical protein
MRPRRSRLAEITLEKAQAERTQLEVASWTLEAAEKPTERAVNGVDLTATGYAEIRKATCISKNQSRAVRNDRQHG